MWPLCGDMPSQSTIQPLQVVIGLRGGDSAFIPLTRRSRAFISTKNDQANLPHKTQDKQKPSIYGVEWMENNATN